jgi:MFS family permease
MEYGVCKESRPKTEYKDFVSYTIPWIIFILVGTLAWNLIPTNLYPSAVDIGTCLRFCNIAAFGLISGFIADRFGRRPSIIIGQLIMGVSFAILGLFGIFYSSVIIYLTASGVAWGLILTMYLTIPGDLSECGKREKLYSLLVVLPMILMLSIPFFPIAIDFTEYSSPFSQLLALLNFLSIIPVIFLADDTLKKDEIEKIKMKDYAELAGRLLSDPSNNN